MMPLKLTILREEIAAEPVDGVTSFLEMTVNVSVA